MTIIATLKESLSKALADYEERPEWCDLLSTYIGKSHDEAKMLNNFLTNIHREINVRQDDFDHYGEDVRLYESKYLIFYILTLRFEVDKLREKLKSMGKNQN